ncbi:MAG TPA: hypothetical protein VMT46_01295 [Anaerolineaceae bacterium]|nr:hypothetical protein [Anaerolineaceae bacterium]
MDLTVACIISSHGYGHAARSSAVMTAMQQRRPDLKFEIITQVNPPFFQVSFPGKYTCHIEWTDVGLVQNDPFVEDLSGTANRLEDFLSDWDEILQRIHVILRETRSRLVIADIAPIGIAAARAANLPSVLIENFTWDWIYSGYPGWREQVEKPIHLFADCFRSATYHIQTIPVCSPDPNSNLLTQPVSRPHRIERGELRASLHIPPGAKVVLITTGGIENRPGFLDRLTGIKNVFFLVPGGSKDRLIVEGGLVAFPHQSTFFHPDLVNASDAVIGKAGYSTIAEVYRAGIPFGFISRENFPESASLEKFIRDEIPGVPIALARFDSGDWLSDLDQILSLPRVECSSPNGADQISDFLLPLL